MLKVQKSEPKSNNVTISGMENLDIQNSKEL